MKKAMHLQIAALVVPFLLAPVSLFAQDQAVTDKVGEKTPEQAKEETISGTLGLGGETFFSGRRDSAKFDEYRDTPQGLFGGGQVAYQNKNGYYFDLQGEILSSDDQRATLESGQYSSWKAELEHNRMPHNYAFGAKSLYSGAGSEDLHMSEALRSQLQNSSGSLTDVTNILNNELTSASEIDLGTTIQKDSARLSLMKWDPFNVTAEVKRATQKGTRPLGGSFGFSNAVEIIEPRDYQTMEYKLLGEYATSDLYFSAAYYASVFDNGKDVVRFDNPFRLTDSVGAPAQGLTDLAPDNYFQNVAVNGAVRNLPWKSDITSALSFGFMRQNDSLVPYTINSAINQSAGAPFDASQPSSLPHSADQSVNTALWDIKWTAEPACFLDTKAFYRYYLRDNQSGTYAFPGYVSFDSGWQPGTIHTQPIGYDRHTAGADAGFEVYDKTRLGVDYKFDRMNRDYREVSTLDDNAFELSLDNKSWEYLNLRTAWEHSFRNISGHYDPTVPYDGESPNAQLPFLRKYDEADRVRDAVNFLASVFPAEGLDVTASFLMGVNNYDHSDFGLTDDTQFVYSLDVAYELTKTVQVYTFYSFEQHNAKQKDRQWQPGGAGDPYLTDTTTASMSNWNAKLVDEANTVGAGFDYQILPKILLFKTAYTLSYSTGHADFSSPIAREGDANSFNPKNYNSVDDVMIHTLSPQLVWTIRKNMDLTLGYLWEYFHASDFAKTGFANVVADTSGAYNGGLLMGTLPVTNYNVNLAFARFDYRF
jgi:MtrB/PioB family decaheme-associated outer membrane protein